MKGDKLFYRVCRPFISEDVYDVQADSITDAIRKVLSDDCTEDLDYFNRMIKYRKPYVSIIGPNPELFKLAEKLK